MNKKIIVCSALSLLWYFDSNAMQLRAMRQQQEAAKQAEIQRIIANANSTLGELQKAGDLDAVLKVLNANLKPAVTEAITAAKETAAAADLNGLLGVANNDKVISAAALAEIGQNKQTAADAVVLKSKRTIGDVVADTNVDEFIDGTVKGQMQALAQMQQAKSFAELEVQADSAGLAADAKQAITAAKETAAAADLNGLLGVANNDKVISAAALAEIERMQKQQRNIGWVLDPNSIRDNDIWANSEHHIQGNDFAKILRDVLNKRAISRKNEFDKLVVALADGNIPVYDLQLNNRGVARHNNYSGWRAAAAAFTDEKTVDSFYLPLIKALSSNLNDHGDEDAVKTAFVFIKDVIKDMLLLVE